MKRLLSFLVLILISATVFAQDSSGTSTGSAFQWPSWATTASLVIVGIYELVARLVPTIKNYSIIGVIITIIQKIFPNQSVTATKLP